MDKISEHITFEEATKSQTAIRKGIDNTPTEEHLANMKYLAETIFEPIRAHFGKPIGISSFYRGPALNKAIGGSKTSAHVSGQAMDIDGDIFGGVSNKDIFEYIIKNLPFMELIWEFGNDDKPDWVHVAISRDPKKNVKEILRAVKQGTKTVYLSCQQH